MSVLQSTLILYRDSARDAGAGLARSAWAVVALVLAYAVTAVASVLLGPFGMLGGFALGFLQAVLVGWYLSLVEIGVAGRRRVQWSDLTENVGSYWQTVISVMFLFWMAQFLLGAVAPPAVPALVIVASLVFNPAPEMVYSEHSASVALLQDALSFMQQNWPEWLGGMALGAACLVAWGMVMFPGLGGGVGLALAQMFGPFFGFVGVAGIALARLDLVGFAGSVVLLAFTHFFLLFRGHLYRRLRGTSRRSRAWQQRMR